MLYSCSDDDFDSRNDDELEIHFNVPELGGESFCFVSDVDGSVLWDTIFSENMGTTVLSLSATDQITLTYGIYAGTTYLIETYEVVEDAFYVERFGRSECEYGLPSNIGGPYKMIRIHGIGDWEIIQSGLLLWGNIDYNPVDSVLTIECSLPLSLTSDDPIFSFLVLEDEQSGTSRSVLLDHELFNGTDVLDLDFTSFEEPQIHTIQLDEFDVYYTEVIGWKGDDIYYLNSNPGFSPLSSPTSQIRLFLPDSVEMDRWALGLSSLPINSLRTGMQSLFDDLPESIEMEKPDVHFELVERDQYILSVGEGYDVIEVTYGYLVNGAWKILHNGDRTIEFTLPEFPESILQHFPTIHTALSDPGYLAATVYKFEEGQFVPDSWDMQSWNVERKCLLQSYGSQNEFIP